MSTTYVYGETNKNGNTEEDLCNPKSTYAKQKFEAENQIKMLCDDYIVFRTSWCYGDVIGSKTDFLHEFINKCKENNIIKVEYYQVGSPTYVYEVIKQLEILIQKDFTGIFNIVNEGKTTRYTWAKHIARIFNLKNIKIVKNSYIYANIRDKISKYNIAKNKKLSYYEVNIMSDWKTALKNFQKKHNGE